MNVQFEERPAQHGMRIGIASLDAEKASTPFRCR